MPTSVAGVIRVWSAAEAWSPGSQSRSDPYAFLAPGAEILTTLPGDSYGFMSGSSFAAAHVSGVVALILEISPRIDSPKLNETLRTASHATPQPGEFSAIIVNACSALAAVDSAVACSDSGGS